MRRGRRGKKSAGGSDVEAHPPALLSECQGTGWIEIRITERKRKKADPWRCEQYWLHWEEPGGQKRSRYIPKAKLDAVNNSVYEFRHPISKTLELLKK